MLRPDVIHRAVESVDREVALLAAHASVADAAELEDFRRSWAKLVDLLELGTPADASTGEAGGIVPPLTRSGT